MRVVYLPPSLDEGGISAPLPRWGWYICPPIFVPVVYLPPSLDKGGISVPQWWWLPQVVVWFTLICHFTLSLICSEMCDVLISNKDILWDMLLFMFQCLIVFSVSWSVCLNTFILKLTKTYILKIDPFLKKITYKSIKTYILVLNEYIPFELNHFTLYLYIY